MKEDATKKIKIINAVLSSVILASGCTEFGRDNGVAGPKPPDSTVTVQATVDSVELFTGSRAMLNATAAGGTPPYLFQWVPNGGPQPVIFDPPSSAATATSPLTGPGRYSFRVAATDAIGARGIAYAAVDVVDPVEITVPPLALVGDATELIADTSSGPTGTSVEWEVLAGPATVNNAAFQTALLTATAPGTVDLRLTFQAPDAEAITRDFEIVAVENLRPRVRVETTLGNFTIELEGDVAPLHTASSLLYVDDAFYDGLLIHRVVCRDLPGSEDCDPFVIQGGGFERDGDELVPVEPTRNPVTSEADNGLSNGELYSVALALSGGNRNSGTTQFFINLDEDNATLDAQGFTVFGRVVAGQDVVDEIARVETAVSDIIPREQSQPVDDVVIVRALRE